MKKTLLETVDCIALQETLSRRFPHAADPFRMLDEALHRLCQRLDILLRNDETCHSVFHHVRDGAHGRCDDGQGVLHSFQQHERAAVIERGVHKHISLLQHALLLFPVQPTVVLSHVGEALSLDGSAKVLFADFSRTGPDKVHAEIRRSSFLQQATRLQQNPRALGAIEIRNGQEVHHSLDSVRADDNLLLIDNLGDVIIEAPREQDDGGAAVDEAEQEAVERASGIGGHAFVMLVDDDAAAEEFAEQHEGCILQKTHTVAGDGQVAGLRSVEHQLAQRAHKTSGKAQRLLHQQQGREVVGLCTAAGGGQIDVAAIKGDVDALTVLDLLTHHAGAVHRRGQGHDEENALN